MNQNNTPVVDTFLAIVQIDSPTGQEQKMTDYVYQRLSSLGLKPTIDSEGNVLAHIVGDQGMEPIFLNAHLDTVEPGRGIKPVINHEGWIKSDGSTVLGGDNKSAVAAILEAAKIIVESKSSHRPIDILFTVSEEGNAHGAIGFDYSQLKAQNGFSFDISNQDFGTVFISAPFYNRLTIKLIGKSGHAKSPENAANVLPIFVKAMSQLPLGRYSPNTVVNLGIVQSGTSVNTIPGEMLLVGEVRSSIESELEEVINQYKKTFEEAALNSLVKVDFLSQRENPGYKIDPNNPFLQQTISLLKKLGLNPTTKDSFGCADANFFAAHGLTTINISDGTLDSHTVDERVSIDNLNRLVSLIVHLSANSN